MMSRLQSSNPQKGLLLRLLVCSLAASLQLAHASRALQQANSCVVLGSSSLRNCNNPTCNCEGKSRDGNSCRCRGECDPTFRNCDGNQNNQANCDCSGNPLLGAGAKAVQNTVAAVAGNPPPAPAPKPNPPPAPKPAPAPAPKPAPAPAPAPQPAPATQTTQTPGVYQFGPGGMTPANGGVIPIGGGVIPIGGGGGGQPVGFGFGR